MHQEDILLPSMSDEFATQRYPSVEETLTNNARVLYRQKKHFLGDLRRLMGTLGFMLIGIVYLRDLSSVFFFFKIFLHYFLTDPFPTPLPQLVFSDDSKKEHAKFLLNSVIMLNTLSLLSHLLYGTYTLSKAPDRQLHGGMTFQFIGERLPVNVWELVLYDVVIFCLQVVFHCITCGSDDLEILLSLNVPLQDIEGGDETVQLDVLSDGYNGIVLLMTVDVFATVQRVLLFKRTVSETPQPGLSLRNGQLQGIFA